MPHADASEAKAPFLFAQRIEDPKLPTVFGYGHGDVIRGARTRVEGRAVAVDADRARRSLVRPRHRRQQGASAVNIRASQRGIAAARLASTRNI